MSKIRSRPSGGRPVVRRPTEIDLAAALRVKFGMEVARQVILGAGNPHSACAALQVEESIGVLLFRNVVVRPIHARRTIVEAVDHRPCTCSPATKPFCRSPSGLG